RGPRAACRGHAAGARAGLLPIEGPSAPDEDQRHREQEDEDEDLDQDEDARGHSDDDAHRVEEDDLDVEEDEEHRDHVEADPEAERARDLARQAALVGLGLGSVWPLWAENVVEEDEGAAYQHPEADEDENR